MIKLISRWITCCTAFALLSQLQAAEPVGELFGGFKPGKKFTFTVKSVECTKGSLGGLDSEVIPIPKVFPAYKVGQKVTFTIGQKGQLTGPGFSFPLNQPSPLKNYYCPSRGVFKGGSALVEKSSPSKALSIRLMFVKLSADSSRNTIMKLVDYTLE